MVLLRGRKIFAVSNKDGTKIQSLKKNPEVYFLVDIADRGVRGRGRAKVIDDPEYAVKILSRNLMRYVGSLDSPQGQRAGLKSPRAITAPLR